MSSTFELSTGSDIQLLYDFEENVSLQVLLCIPRVKKQSLIFQDRGLEATKRLQLSNVSEVLSRFSLSRSEL